MKYQINGVEVDLTMCPFWRYDEREWEDICSIKEDARVPYPRICTPDCEDCPLHDRHQVVVKKV